MMALAWDRLGQAGLLPEAPPEAGHRGAVSGSAPLNVCFIYLCTTFNSLFILHVSMDSTLAPGSPVFIHRAAEVHTDNGFQPRVTRPPPSLLPHWDTEELPALWLTGYLLPEAALRSLSPCPGAKTILWWDVAPKARVAEAEMLQGVALSCCLSPEGSWPCGMELMGYLHIFPGLCWKLLLFSGTKQPLRGRCHQVH